LASDPVAAAMMPVYSSVSATMQRDRRANQPALPRSRRDIQIPQKLSETASGDRLLLTSGIIFTSDSDLQRLCSSSVLSMDGTFQVTPTLFSQLFTIHAFVADRLVPLVFVLMSEKTTIMYNEMFDALKAEVTRRGLVLAPSEIMSDFESGIIAAVAQQFPTPHHKGCYFYFCQCIWHNVQALGLANRYGSDANIRLQVRQLMALAFAPMAVIRPTIAILEQNSDPALTQLFSYFRDQWLTRVRIQMWNVYKAELRTNNDLEGWHNRFSNLVSRHHPNIWDFLRFMIAEHDATYVSIQQTLAGQNVRRRHVRQENMEKRLRKLCRRYRHGSITVVEYITAVSYNLASFG
jgi:hypothetical protein